MKKWYFLVIILFLAVYAAFAQNREFMPYVSNIRVETRNNLIRLSWIDSPDARGPVYIFRSARPITGSIPANIRPVIINYGVQYYVDDVDDMQNIYYFVAASDTYGNRYDIILSHINTTSLIPDRSLDSSSVIIAAPPPPEFIDGIYNLRARQNEERVIITFESSYQHRRAILYRSTQPIHQVQDLINAIIVQPDVSSPFIDIPVPGLNWYYTVIYEDEISSGNMGIRPGINTTVSAITILNEQNQERSLRPIPLPILSLGSSGYEGYFITEIPSEDSLSFGSASMLRNTLMPQKEPLDLKRPRVFSIDLVAPLSGEDSALFQIVMEYFLEFEWETTRINLQHYLSLPRTREVEARARFYLGQSLYYTGFYREALMEFLTFRSLYPGEANVWIEAILTAMVY